MRGAFSFRGPVHRSPKALPLGTAPAPYAMPAPSLFDFLRDAESWRGMRQGLTDAANRGIVAGTLGAPVDMATQAANLGIAGAGYIGHKAGLLSTPPELIDSRNVPGSSEWIGQKMQDAGMVSPNRNPVAEFGMGLLSPVAFKAAQKAGGLLANAEMKAAENAAKPSAMRVRYQRGAALAKFKDGGHYAVNDLSQYTPKLYRETSIDKADAYLPGSQTMTQPAQLYFANEPSFAMGQGGNKGVLLEFSANGMRGQLDMRKPAARQAYDSGLAEFFARDATPDEFQNNLLSVTVQPGESGPFLRRLEGAAKAAGLRREVGPDGSIVFTRAD